MKAMRCELIGLVEHQCGVFTATIRRIDDHPRLGKPTGSLTRTSQINLIDFERRYMITQNSVYWWE